MNRHLQSFNEFNESSSFRKAATGLALAAGLAFNPPSATGQIKGTEFQKYEMPKTATNILGKVKRGPILIADLSFERTESDANLYTLRFLDANTSYRNTGLKTEVMESIKFSATNAEIDDLYNFLKKMIDQPNTFKKEISVGENSIVVITQKAGFGMTNVAIHINETMVFGLSDKEIDKLFGK